MNAGEDRNEWFKCSVNDVMAAIVALRTGNANVENRTQTFKMRPEQFYAVEKTVEYFKAAKRDEPDRIPKFLWNAKMRFGKTFASYQLAKKMKLKRVLVLTFKPAVESAWCEDLVSHVDFEGWQFVSNKDAHNNNVNIDQQFAMSDKSRPIVVFGSFQDLLGTNDAGGIKAKNEFIHDTNWDLVIFDEYHFGAWRENAKKLFENPDEEADSDFDMEKYKQDEADNAYNESFLPITTDYYLFLSGTPFRAINSGEFIEDQIYNWTYSDEQKAKDSWVGSNNPYASLPRMVMLTYKVPDSITQIAKQGEFDEFDLNVFFSAKGKGDEARFVYENEVQKWLDLIRGAYLPSSVDDMKLGQDKRPPMPYSDTRLLNVLSLLSSNQKQLFIAVQASHMTYHDNADLYFQYCTAFPVGTALAQTWDVALMERFGQAIAAEMQEFHVDLWLAPGMNIQRNPLCGRNFEYYSEDPMLAGAAAAAVTMGVQSQSSCGVTIKHFAGNNQEDNRMGVDSRISPRALREIYLRNFEIAVKTAKPKAIMTSYNLVNGVHSANSRELCTTVAREEWGFDGIIMSDWNTTVPEDGSTPWKCAAAGNDIIMPGNPQDSQNIRQAVKDGLLSEEAIRACAGRIIDLATELSECR